MYDSSLLATNYIYQDGYDGQRVNRANGHAIQIFSVLTIIMALMPLTTFMRLRTVGQFSLVLVSIIFSLFALINASIWDTDDHARWFSGTGLCHVEASLRQPLTVAFSLAMVLIPWRLIRMLRSDSSPKPQILSDILFIWGVPLFFILPFQYLVMTNAYSIVPGFGCVPEFDDSWLSLVIVYIWWILLLPVTFILSGIMCVAIYQKHLNFSIPLDDNSSSGINRTYIKLYILAIGIIAIYIPVQLTFIIRFVPSHFTTKSTFTVQHSDSWNKPHFYHTSDDPQIQYQPWAYIAINFFIFSFFGFTGKAWAFYWQILQRLGLGKIFPNIDRPQPKWSTYDSGESRTSLLSYVDLVGYVTRKLERQRKLCESQTF
ncbi:Pheromone a factor receptor [Erysiphe neolycopersici]|uniref:Pheromone a factor receptor n=1 Tax=Erysiphe neolycopersici TaxID=212602 RepID=A0A420I078_9PEZI|nr:Pheromone a factor receptor [Erysiphe neolycopersici]